MANRLVGHAGLDVGVVAVGRQIGPVGLEDQVQPVPFDRVAVDPGLGSLLTLTSYSSKKKKVRK